jgi:hypothetical protein
MSLGVGNDADEGKLGLSEVVYVDVHLVLVHGGLVASLLQFLHG